MTTSYLHRRTSTASNPPASGSLQPGEFAIEMATSPPRLWVGVPTTVDPTGRIQLVPSGVTSLNALLGALAITAGAGITVTPSAPNIQIAGSLFGSAAQGNVPASGGGTANFLRADGTWAAPGGGTPAEVLLGTINASNQQYVNVTSYITSTYDSYKIVAEDVTISAYQATEFYFQLSQNNGSTWVAGTNYYWVTNIASAYSGAVSIGGQYQWGAPSVMLTGGQGTGQGISAAPYSLNFELNIRKPLLTNIYKLIDWNLSAQFYGAAANAFLMDFRGTAWYFPTAAINAIRFYFGTGNIASGKFSIYGRNT